MAGEAIVGVGILVVMLFIFLWFLIVGLAIFAFVFWILMIVDVAQRTFKKDTDKIVWVLVIIFTGIIGAIIYYFVIKRHNKH